MFGKKIVRFAAMAAAVAMLATSGFTAALAAENTGKHFSVVEAASGENSLSVSEIAKKCRRSVVAIETETKVIYNNNYYNDPFSMFGFGYGFGYGYGGGNGRGRQQEYTQTAAGSGVILSEDGYIVTNNHVISGADKITVYVLPENEGEEEASYEATLVGASESNDIAVLKIDAENLVPATVGDSETLEIGELAVAIGNPMGTIHGSVTAGIISATQRSITIDGVTINAIQTDAAINPGNSGGALFDSFGNLIGVVYARSGITYEGIGYAIPISGVREMIENMINNPDEVKAQTDGSKIMLGITIADVTEAMSRQYGMPVGVYVKEVASMSAAERAGMMVGDIIVEFANEPVKSSDDLNAIKSKQTPGDTVTCKVDRNGETRTLNVILPQPTEVSTEK